MSLNNLGKIFKNKVFLAILACVFIGGGAFFFFQNGNGKEKFQVQKKDIVQKIMVTGKTKAKQEVELGFDKTGRVARVFFDVGDKVNTGAVIAELDISSELADLAKEKAVLAEQEAKLGGEGEKLAYAIKESFAVADNAVRNKIDQFFNQPRENPAFEVKFTDGNFIHYFSVSSDLSTQLNNDRKKIESILTQWQKDILEINPDNAQNFADEAVYRMDFVSSFLNKMAFAVNSFSSSDFDYESTVTGYKTAVDTARTNVETSRSSLISAKDAFSAKSTGGISSGQAKINQIKASILSLEASLQKSKIVSPFSGTLTKQDAKVGSIATAGAGLISLISEDDMYIEANISEINIGKVLVGNPAQIQFDAFPGEIFSGKISYIEPGENIIDGVVNYKTRISFDNFDPKIKNGLTANVEIEVGRKNDVLAIPSFSVYQKESANFVQKVSVGNSFEEVQIEIGVAGSDGMVEVISGLSEGDEVIFSGK